MIIIDDKEARSIKCAMEVQLKEIQSVKGRTRTVESVLWSLFKRGPGERGFAVMYLPDYRKLVKMVGRLPDYVDENEYKIESDRKYKEWQKNKRCLTGDHEWVHHYSDISKCINCNITSDELNIKQPPK